MDTLLQWAKGQGCSFADIEVKGRDLFARSDIPNETALFDIPQHLLLHEGQAWNHQAYGKAFQQLKEEVGDALDKRWTLCLLLLIERACGDQSKWATYIKVLPHSYEDPIWWSEEELEIIKGTRLGAAVEYYAKGQEDLHAWRARLCTIQRELGGNNVLAEEAGQWAMSETALRWAKSTVWSRAFNVKALGAAQKEGIALIPVLDMLDHHPERHVAWHTGYTGQDNFRFVTKFAITKGDQLFSNYGHKSNEELLLGYGFILEPNAADFFSVSLGLETSSAAGRERAAMLRALLHRLGLQTDFYLTRPYPLPSTLLVAAAACLLPSASAYSLLQTIPPPSLAASSNDWDDPDGAHPEDSSMAIDEQRLGSSMIEVKPTPVAAAAAPADGPVVRSGLQLACPVAVHLQALLALKQQLTGKLDKLQGGSSQDDMQLAAAASAGSPRHMALVYRAGQKEIAHAALAELAQQTEDLLEGIFSADSTNVATPGSTLEAPSQQDRLSSRPAMRERRAEKPWDWGLEVLQDCDPGQELAGVPLSAGVLAGARAHMSSDLALARLRLQIDEPPACKDDWPVEGSTDACSPSKTEEAARCSSGPGLMDRLIQYVDVPFAATLLSGDKESLSTAEALAGTGLGDLVQGESEHYLEQHAAAVPPLRAAIARILEEGDGPLEAQSCTALLENCPNLGRVEVVQALAWADAVLDRCGIPGPSKDEVAILPLICALPKALRGLALDFSWDETGREPVLVVSAAVHLKAGMVLSHAPLLRDSSFENLLLDWGPSSCADLSSDAAGTSCAYELCMDPPDEHPHADLCRDVLVASGLGGTHWLTMTTRQEPLLAAVAVCCSDEDSLHAMGAADLLRQHAAMEVNPTEAEPKMTGVGDAGVSHQEHLRQLWAAGEKFVTAVKQDKHLMKAARRQLQALLQDAWDGLSPLEVKEGQKVLQTILDYRFSMRKIVEHHLNMLQRKSKRPVSESTAANARLHRPRHH